MKKRMSFFACLAFFTLACLAGEAVTVEAVQLATATATTRSVARVDREMLITITPEILGPAGTCAVVVAVEALHLRGESSADGDVLTWLEAGDVVQVLSDSDPNWWRVSFDDLVGYARAVYLEESECEK